MRFAPRDPSGGFFRFMTAAEIAGQCQVTEQGVENRNSRQSPEYPSGDEHGRYNVNRLDHVSEPVAHNFREQPVSGTHPFQYPGDQRHGLTKYGITPRAWPTSMACCLLPDHRDIVLTDDFVLADQLQSPIQRLADQKTIKGILMMIRKVRGIDHLFV